MNTRRVVLIVLAVLGSLVSLWVLGMWLMHSMMMGGGIMDGGMMGFMACPAFCFLPLLLLGLAVMVVAIILLRRNRMK
jgi:hypothetical protein